jgi:serine/threonine-protein kinase
MVKTDPLVGTTLGEYQVLEAIGEGGMGVVYRGLQPVIKKRVAIKVLKPNSADGVSQVKRLTDEAEAVNSIGHRAIIDIFSLGQLPDGRPYIVMEFLEGQPLDLFVQSQGRLEVREVLSLLIAMCGPLAAAHRAGVIHRDLKPSNLFVCFTAMGERYLKLLDFGLAKKAVNLDGSSAQTSRATVTGTPNYMAPEQARGEDISPRTDIYALGVMAFELLTGELPYSAPGAVEVLMQHVSAPIPSVRALVPEVPPVVDELIRRMMAKSPSTRVQTVEEVREVLIDAARVLGPSMSFDTLDPVSGEHQSNRHRPLVTPANSAPALELALHGDTLISQRTLRPRRWRYIVGLVVVILGLSAAILFTDNGSAKPTVDPALELTRREQALAQEKAALAARELAARDEARREAAAKDAAREAAAREAVDREAAAREAAKEPPVVEKSALKPQVVTAAALRERVTKLELTLQRVTPAGEDPDPSALTLLRKYRVEATMVDSVEERRALAKRLDSFERSFLKQ